MVTVASSSSSSRCLQYLALKNGLSPEQGDPGFGGDPQREPGDDAQRDSGGDVQSDSMLLSWDPNCGISVSESELWFTSNCIKIFQDGPP